MLSFLVSLVISAVAVWIAAKIMPGVEISNMWYALLVALVLALLDTFLKPLLVLVSLPATVLTLGLFALVINAVIILICSYLVKAFTVKGFWYALLYSIVLSVINSVLCWFFNSEGVI